MTERAVSDDIDVMVPLRDLEALRGLVKELATDLSVILKRFGRVSKALEELATRLDLIVLEEQFEKVKGAMNDAKPQA